MQKYTATTKTVVKTESTIIEPDGYSTIEVSNIGDDTIFVNNNVPVLPGGAWTFENREYVTISELTSIRFEGVGTTPKALVQFIYYKEV